MDESKALNLQYLQASTDRHERATAIIGLASTEDSGYLEFLKPLTTDSDNLVAIAAIFTCMKLGDESADVDRLVAGLGDENEEVKQLAVHVLCDLGNAVVPELESMLKSKSVFTEDILEVLGDIGGEESYAVLSRFESDDDEMMELLGEILEDWEG